MIKVKNKLYSPTPLLRTISAFLLIIAAGMFEAATSINQFIIPVLMTIIFGYITLSDKPDR